MTLPKNKFREAVFQALCALDSTTLVEDIIPLLMQQLRISKRHAKSAIDSALEIIQLKASLDEKIKPASISYDFDRIRLVELNVIRLGLYEIFYDEEVPDKVAISEAMRICKKFSTPEATAFVNAILDRVYKEKENVTVEEENQISLALENEDKALEKLKAQLT